MRSALIRCSSSPQTPSSSTTAVPYQTALVSVTLSGSNTCKMVSEDREIREDVDVDRLGGGEIERLRRAVAETAAQLRFVMLHAGMRAFHRPHRARLDLHVRTLVLEVMAVAEILHVHRLLVGPALVIGHALVGFLHQPVLHVEQRAMREHDMIAVAGIVVGELPVAVVFQPIGLADRDLAAGMAVEPFVERASSRRRDNR